MLACPAAAPPPPPAAPPPTAGKGRLVLGLGRPPPVLLIGGVGPPPIPLLFDLEYHAPARDRTGNRWRAQEMRVMRTRLGRLFLVGALLLAVTNARAQQEVPPVDFTGPLSHPRYESGGIYAGLQG